MALSVQQISVGGYDKNLSYLIWDDTSKRAAYVDPTGDWQKVLGEARALEVDIVMILLTHTHFDHFDKADEVVAVLGEMPVYVHELGVEKVAAAVGREMAAPFPARLTLGEHPIDILHTPGHSPDSVCFSIAPEQAADHTPHLITGDTLFVGGCGRTTAEQVEDLYNSLQQLKALPEQTHIYPGHDYGLTSISSIRHETATNRFLLATNFEEFKHERFG